MPEYQYVDLQTDDRIGTIIREQSRIGVDTEFAREKTFFAELCLIQIATPDMIYCADPMGLDARNDDRGKAIWRGLTSPAWVLHSGRQDLEVIYQTVDVVPEDISRRSATATWSRNCLILNSRNRTPVPTGHNVHCPKN
jgi:ribonuclease D